MNLPQSGEQTSLKPVTEVYIDAESKLWLVADRNDSIEENSEARAVTRDELLASLMLIQRQDSLHAVALYADSTVAYARVIEVLDRRLAIISNLCWPLATHKNKSPLRTTRALRLLFNG